MLLKSLELENFRQFYGIQKIEFATDKMKNVTVVMGENTSGKTTLAQAFTWCLYGTTKFKSPEVMSNSVKEEMAIGESRAARVTITLLHNKLEYSITRSMEGKKSGPGKITYPSGPIQEISFLNIDGQTKYIKDADIGDLIKEILPEQISSYFFFDGERIDLMSKDIQNGRGNEFSVAVKSLLGLSVLSSTIDHLYVPGRGKTTVTRLFNEDFNQDNDKDFSNLTKLIEECDAELAQIDSRLLEIKDEKLAAENIRDRVQKKIEENRTSKDLGEERVRLRKEIDDIAEKRARLESGLLLNFNQNAHAYFMSPLAKKALGVIDNEVIIDTVVARGVSADTLDDIAEKGQCICGTTITDGSDEYNTLEELRQLVPPESIGTMITTYENLAKPYREDSLLFPTISNGLTSIRDYQKQIDDKLKTLNRISDTLSGMEDVSELEKRHIHACKEVNGYEEEIGELNTDKGRFIHEKKKAETEKNSLQVNDIQNKRIKSFLSYTKFIHDRLNKIYKSEENEIRGDLETAINEVFQNTFDGSFSLKLDDKYNITVQDLKAAATDSAPETSEAQNITIIFAFIAGVIKLARDEKKERSEMIITETYPLVMDAPLSNFDKRRIKAVSEIMPTIAEQVVLFIKDIDGELAEQYLGESIGAKYSIKVIEANRKSKIEGR